MKVTEAVNGIEVRSSPQARRRSSSAAVETRNHRDALTRLKNLTLYVVFGDARRRFKKRGKEETRRADRAARYIIPTFAVSAARILVMKRIANLVRKTEWGNGAFPALRQKTRFLELVEVSVV